MISFDPIILGSSNFSNDDINNIEFPSIHDMLYDVPSMSSNCIKVATFRKEGVIDDPVDQTW